MAALGLHFACALSSLVKAECSTRMFVLSSSGDDERCQLRLLLISLMLPNSLVPSFLWSGKRRASFFSHLR